MILICFCAKVIDVMNKCNTMTQNVMNWVRMELRPIVTQVKLMGTMYTTHKSTHGVEGLQARVRTKVFL